MVIGEFNDAYPPELDGVGRVVKSYAEELSRLGDECYYIAPDDPGYKGKHAYETLLYKGVKMPSEPYHVGVPVLDIRYMLRENRVRFDIVHAHSPFLAGQEAMRIANRRHIPLVATFHSKYYDDFYRKTGSETLAGFGTRMVVEFYNKCDEVWAVSEKTAQVLREYGYRRDIVVMPNGTDPWQVSEEDLTAVERLYHLGNEPVFLYAGQMNWKKNIRKTLEAMALYGKTRPYRLLMTGQGPDEKEIQAYARELGLGENVCFTGHISDRRRMMSIFARADLLIFPSLYDNAPMVVREAAAVGTPAVLLKDSCAAEGVTDGVNGLLCEDSAESIVLAIERGFPALKEIGLQAQKTIPIPWKEIIAKAREHYGALIKAKKAQ